jgi:hypothetical protein
LLDGSLFFIAIVSAIATMELLLNGILMRDIRTIVFIVLSVGLLSQPAWAEKRVALVLGNSAYQNVTPLTNPTGDSVAIAEIFQKAGFDFVDLKRNLGVNETRRALRDFSDKVRDADVAVVYFAGHGMEIDGTNYGDPSRRSSRT